MAGFPFFSSWSAFLCKRDKTAVLFAASSGTKDTPSNPLCPSLPRAGRELSPQSPPLLWPPPARWERSQALFFLQLALFPRQAGVFGCQESQISQMNEPGCGIGQIQIPDHGALPTARIA